MARLIDAKALFNDLADYWGIPKDWDGRIDKLCEDALASIENAPTVDVVPVVHGRWEIFDDGYGCELMCCSVCKAEFYDGDNDTIDQPHNYCPNCGAKMDGDGNG